ncbi:bifunctional diaminohydroxyphosphoribosylaminopyrimidine deaminase/5-amino-6-(5-phosphoribosylamino)uracil reductase RibD [Zhihengliuella flava]|uniref:Riboflavin biosynthesis protein RibD n=1 Tax=Zhihengliuella flava TaxID=1285193 RepID=A0A931D8R4_9MICC|nr:bifunctional diaminohydroxyphosphoribosylaminopyrimidine deaminase/5-amino-6-(5-phosphoribosylamino)uracil reductase RibD [Zhihengliuella flava]MBG6085720.1 diaminohydroxyphosphoribosylaminopyrimidine deaminase/5-amino-6-(5-phosphoribosylamino)uracil reductase [Zhihengliuella flava]
MSRSGDQPVGALPFDVEDVGARALAAARLGVRGANPLVGAVIVDAAGRRIAVGHHRGAGTPHAEADALANLRADVESGRLDITDANPPGAWTMVVTLEPCHHTGRTGPCSHAIRDAGIGTVVYAVADSTDTASGGAAWLAAQGHRVIAGSALAPEWSRAAAQLNHRWFSARAAGRPFTTLHLAQTLDGRIAAADGTSQWITSTASRHHSHRVRARAEAIIVGSGTVAADNPRLTARLPDGSAAPRTPLRVVMGHRDVPEGAALVGDGHYRHVRSRDPRAVLAELASVGIDHAMIEGGASIATAFLREDLVDEIWLYQAPLVLGSGRGAVGDLGIDTLSAARRFEYDDVGDGALARCGDDVVLHLTPRAADHDTDTLMRR